MRQQSGEETEPPGRTVPFSQPWSLFERLADIALASIDKAIRRGYLIACSTETSRVSRGGEKFDEHRSPSYTFEAPILSMPSHFVTGFHLVVLHRLEKQIVGREYPFGQDSTL